MKRCLECDTIHMSDHSGKFCGKHFAERELNRLTGLSMDDLPDGLPIEDFIDDNGNLDFDAISSW